MAIQNFSQNIIPSRRKYSLRKENYNAVLDEYRAIG
jgi:hypothetical protein